MRKSGFKMSDFKKTCAATQISWSFDIKTSYKSSNKGGKTELTTVDFILSSPDPKAHNTHGPASVRRRPPSLTISNIFSKTASPIKAKFYVEPPWVRGTKVYSRHLGNMTKLAVSSIYGKNPSKVFFSRTGGPIFTKLVI